MTGSNRNPDDVVRIRFTLLCPSRVTAEYGCLADGRNKAFPGRGLLVEPFREFRNGRVAVIAVAVGRRHGSVWGELARTFQLIKFRRLHGLI
jgi:hypothetical protein